MPFFKTTYNILTKYDEDELFNPNWMDSDKLILPPSSPWDYKKNIHIEDVNIWEVIYQESNGIGVYAAYDPYAEFYMITTGFSGNNRFIDGNMYSDRNIETYYGKNVQRMVQKRMIELNIPINTNKIWVDNEDMWMY